jgi:hypothetical protein
VGRSIVTSEYGPNLQEVDMKQTLDEASKGLQTMHHAAVAELQKANEAEAQDYVQFLEAQIESIAQVSKCIEAAHQGKDLPFV